MLKFVLRKTLLLHWVDKAAGGLVIANTRASAATLLKQVTLENTSISCPETQGSV